MKNAAKQRDGLPPRQLQGKDSQQRHAEHTKEERGEAQAPFAPARQAAPAGDHIVVKRRLDVVGGPACQLAQAVLRDGGGYAFVIPEALGVEQKGAQRQRHQDSRPGAERDTEAAWRVAI